MAERSSEDGPFTAEHPLGQPLARGRTAEVYAWEAGWVVKLFHDGVDRASIEYEARLARAVHAAGLPVPAAGDVVTVAGRAGLVYERVEGPSMLELLRRKPWRLFDYAGRLARLQAQVHSAPVPESLPLQREKLERKIRRAAALPARARTAVLAALASMPEGESLCHGDLHPNNILVTANGDVVIDWMDASRGNPLADVARTSIILLGDSQGDPRLDPVLKRLAGLFHRAYLRTYRRLRPQGWDKYRAWLPIVAAARLSEEIPEVEGWLVGVASRQTTAGRQ